VDDNPYASPVDVGDGEWDHRLFWRLVKISAVFIVFFLALDVFFCWQYAKMPHVQDDEELSLGTVERFFTGWEYSKTQ
jgi:hypothetical protein